MAARVALDTIRCMNITAKFLLLVDGARRAILLDDDQRHLGEVIEEDGFIVDSRCPVPSCEALAAMSPAPAANAPMRCFELH
jgi:hypothetical protein